METTACEVALCVSRFCCAKVSTMSGMRRVVLERTGSSRHMFGPDYGVVLAWIDDQTLHAAFEDYGDSDYMGRGIDIPEPTRLLEWLVDDRFLGEWERFASYCDANGIVMARQPDGPPPAGGRRGIPLTWVNDFVYVYEGIWAEPSVCYLIVDWRALVLVLVRDRCEGRNAWSRLTRMLEDAQIEPVERWRGYI
jgi:hypothetical protein